MIDRILGLNPLDIGEVFRAPDHLRVVTRSRLNPLDIGEVFRAMARLDCATYRRVLIHSISGKCFGPKHYECAVREIES